MPPNVEQTCFALHTSRRNYSCKITPVLVNLFFSFWLSRDMQRQCTLDILEAYYWSSLQWPPSAAAAVLRNGSHVSSPLRGWRGTCTSPDFSKRTSHNRAFTNEHSFGEAGLTSFSQILKNLEVPQLKESLKNSRGHLTIFNLPEAADSWQISAHSSCTPAFVSTHILHCTQLSLLHSRWPENWKRGETVWAKTCYHWPLLYSLPSPPLPSYETWVALGSLWRSGTGFNLAQQSPYSACPAKLAAFSICS